MNEKQLYHEYEENSFLIKLYGGYFDNEHPDHVWAEFWGSEDPPQHHPIFIIGTHDKETLSYCASVFWGGYRNGEHDGVQSITEVLIHMLQEFLSNRESHETKET